MEKRKLSIFGVCTLIAIRLSLLFTLLLLELHVPMMHHGTGQLVDANLLISSEAQNVNGILGSKYIFIKINPPNL